MRVPWIKRFLPKSLYGRALLIVAAPVMLVLLVHSLYAFYVRHWDSVQRHMAASLAGEIAYVTVQAATVPEEWLPVIVQSAKLQMDLDLSVSLPHSEEGDVEDAYPLLSRMLASRTDYAFTVRESDDGQRVLVFVYTPRHTLEFSADRKRLVSATTYIFTLWMVGTAVLLLGIAFVFLRNQIRPIARLAEAAEDFGRGVDTPDFRARGAREVRLAGEAFIQMKHRIARQMRQRTEMLAAISHDLRTPLTRIKLHLAMLGDGEDIVALQRDVSDMESMIAEYLDFVRGAGGEKSVETVLDDFLRETAEGYIRAGKPVALGTLVPCTAMVRPKALRRAINNLLDNALRYGGEATLSMERTAGGIAMHVDDNGPGIPPEQREDVLQPFTRLDEARNLNQAGVGLGLTITRDIVSSHGGTITLSDAEGGGLRVTVVLPV